MLRTAFTAALAVEHPIALAPMGGVSGGALTAAVANGGGLGLLGGARHDRDWIAAELAVLRTRTARPWGIGLQTWALDQELMAWVLDQGPAAVMLAFGDPGP